MLYIDNYCINTPIIDILYKIRASLTNGKLRDIKEAGDHLMVTCPNSAHAGGHEQHPDHGIYIGNDKSIPYGTTHCFACDYKGPFYHFVAACFDCTDEYAKQWLITNFGQAQAGHIQLDAAIDLSKRVITPQLDETILDTYQPWTPYLAKRRLNQHVCEVMNIRYDPKFRQVIFPCYDRAGHLIMLPKRSIDTKTFYIDKSVEKPLYCIDKIVKCGLSRFMLVEGPIDALTCWSHGVPAVATLGAISASQIAQLNKLDLRTIYLCFDNDAAGSKFLATVQKQLRSDVMAVIVTLPVNRKDVNDLTDDEWDDLIVKNNLPRYTI